MLQFCFSSLIWGCELLSHRRLDSHLFACFSCGGCCRFARSDRQLAALRVVSVVIDGEAFKFEKAFPHVTVWKAEGVAAVESNELNSDNAHVVELAAPLSLPAAVRIA